MHFKYKLHHLFHSNVNRSSWMIVELSEEYISVRDMAYKPYTGPTKTAEDIEEGLIAMASAVQTSRIKDFDKAIEDGRVDFSKHMFQNQTIDGMRNNKNITAVYAKKKNHGGTK